MNGPLNQHDNGAPPERFIGPRVTRPMRCLTKSIRSEQSCVDDPDSETFGLRIIQRALACINGHTFVFFVSPRPERSSLVRTKKGLLKDYPEMKGLDARHGEVEASDTHTSLTTLVCLDDYDFSDPDTFITNWYRSIFLVSSLPIDRLFSSTPRWVREKVRGAVALDLDRLFSDLEHLPSTAVLRYFGADNGRDETIAVIGHEKLLDDKTMDCLECLG